MKTSEKKKLMPTITNYLSDSDDDLSEGADSSTNINNDPPLTQTNYAEWKRLQKVAPNLSNGSKSTQVPLGDISSCDEDFKFDDSEPIFKIMNCLADKEAFRRRNDCIRRKHKKPSHFLLFSRMKQLKHYDCSFNDLNHIIQASWDNLQPTENEELMGNIDYRIQEYKETLAGFRNSLLPGVVVNGLKNNSQISSVSTRKRDVKDSQLISANNIIQKHSKIPERLQSLAGNASIYNAGDKGKRPFQNTFSSYSSSDVFSSGAGLHYVSAINSNPSCNFPHCENKPVEDYRWDGQYCSAKCLIKDCHLALQSWLTDQKEMLINGNEFTASNDDEVMMYLTSPSPKQDRNEPITRDKNIFESLQNNQMKSTDLEDDSSMKNTDNVRVNRVVDLDEEDFESTCQSFDHNSSEIESPNRLEEFDNFLDKSQLAGTKMSL